MKSIQILSTQLLSSSDKDIKKKAKKDFLEETKSNSVSSVDTQKDNNLFNQNLNKNNHECEETEKNKFDISFCLSKDLLDEIENGDDPVISQNDKLEQTNNSFNHQKNQNQFYFNPFQNDENLNNYYYLNENNVNQSNQLYNLNTPHLKILKNYLSKYHAKKIGTFTIKMFGKLGWICLICNNFNYQGRKICNRCHNIKQAKDINNLFSDGYFNEKQKNDWLCSYCGNINFSFREICNMCKIQKNKIIIS